VMKPLLQLSVFMLLGGLCAHAFEPLRAVQFNWVRDDAVLVDCDRIEAYGISVDKFWPDKKRVEEILRKMGGTTTFAKWREKWGNTYRPLDGSFPVALLKAKFLYVGQGVWRLDAAVPFQRYPEAIRRFLENGGTILFDYSPCPLSSTLDEFLAGMGVANPSANSSFKSGDYKAVFSPGTEHPLHKIPNDLTAKLSGGWGWWEIWSPVQTAPFRSFAQPNKRAAMIVQENVLGKGRIIFNQMPQAFRSLTAYGDKALSENILTYVFGRNLKGYQDELLKENGGPGEPAN